VANKSKSGKNGHFPPCKIANYLFICYDKNHPYWQEADMESTLIIVSIIAGIVGTITGVLGLTFTVISNKRNAREKAEEQKRHAQELEWQKQELEMQKQEKARSDRLTFLADRIFDSSIPRELRQPFYEEYISMKGNGTAVRFWQLEAEREKKLQQPA
jgi:hypothetical protein